ncbi:unnamed protein product [Mytilus coruscus]|uniref:Uncharacterized protein n=1 Tax=Mytilus coruscus TaxID=42192 RepID=A0A6J8BJL4_MYTCO|nr:unnamed protein product [Mytilus coruscus]
MAQIFNVNRFLRLFVVSPLNITDGLTIQEKIVVVNYLSAIEQKEEKEHHLSTKSTTDNTVPYVFEEDIILTPKQAQIIYESRNPRQKRKLNTDLQRHWQLPIQYAFDGSHITLQLPIQNVMDTSKLQLPIQNVMDISKLKLPIQNVMDTSKLQLPIQNVMDTSKLQLPIQNVMDTISYLIQNVMDTSKLQLPIQNVMDTSKLQLPIQNVMDTSKLQLPIQNVMDTSKLQLPIQNVMDTSKLQLIQNVLPVYRIQNKWIPVSYSYQYRM